MTMNNSKFEKLEAYQIKLNHVIQSLEKKIPEFVLWAREKRYPVKTDLTYVLYIRRLFNLLWVFYLTSYKKNDLIVQQKIANFIDELSLSKDSIYHSVVVSNFINELEHTTQLDLEAKKTLGKPTLELLEKLKFIPDTRKIIDRFYFVDINKSDTYKKQIPLKIFQQLVNAWEMTEERRFHDWYYYTNERLEVSIPFDEESKLIQKIFVIIYKPLIKKDYDMIHEIQTKFDLSLERPEPGKKLYE